MLPPLKKWRTFDNIKLYNAPMDEKIFSPCKVNLMLAITGRRNDGFHNLISLVAPTAFGDELGVKELPNETKADTLSCNLDGVPLDASNLVIKAAKLFREATGGNNFFAFDLHKRTPFGAGLGGGSSNGAAALIAMNRLCGNPLGIRELEIIAAELGSDCPLFLKGNPVVMRGRGEQVFDLGAEASECISRLKLLLFKPSFSISTAWAYSQMRENPQYYADSDDAEASLSEWLENPSISGLPLFNNMQLPAFKKYPALEAAICEIRERFGIPAMMSGSGSACFAIINDIDEESVAKLEGCIKDMFGKSCFIARA